jgi:arsenate reductase
MNRSKHSETVGKFMQIYGLKNCDTCRKALKSLPQAQLLDVRVDGVPTEVMQAAFAQFDAALLNTRSTTWRGLSEGERGSAPLDLIAQHPALMKRPLIVDGGQMFLGWTKDVQAVLLGA